MFERVIWDLFINLAKFDPINQLIPFSAIPKSVAHVFIYIMQMNILLRTLS